MKLPAPVTAVSSIDTQHWVEQTVGLEMFRLVGCQGCKSFAMRDLSSFDFEPEVLHY